MLQKIRLKPGLDKQSSDTGAEGQWFDGNNVRFRYGTPEKIVKDWLDFFCSRSTRYSCSRQITE